MTSSMSEHVEEGASEDWMSEQQNEQGHEIDELMVEQRKAET